MNTADILALVHAGFTRDEINAMYGAPAPTPAPAEPAPAPAPAEPAPAPAPAGNELKELLDTVKTLVSAVQAGNRAGAAQPAPKTDEEILASIFSNNN